MMNSGLADDPHRAIGSDVLAAKCVEHIPAADSALPHAAIPTVVCSENVVVRGNNTPGAHNVVGGVLIKKRKFFIGKHSFLGVPCFQCG